jgi:CSLREA domain-containing protein
MIAVQVGSAATFTVNSTGDQSDANVGDSKCDVDLGAAGNQCTLRAAIEEANYSSVVGTIWRSTAVKSIRLTRELPEITKPVFISGFFDESDPRLELDGSGLSSATGLEIKAGNSTISNLVINGFHTAIFVDTKGNNTISDNFIGTDVTGKAVKQNSVGILLGNAPANLIRGNLISGNVTGIVINGPLAQDNRIEKNHIGTDKDGTSSLPNLNGIRIDYASRNLIGGSTSGSGNVISGNTDAGINIAHSKSSENTVKRNYIGTDKTGTKPLGNRVGIIIFDASHNMIGGSGSGEGNVISGNRFAGVQVESFFDTATGNKVDGNFIGTAVGGSTALGNGNYGIEIKGPASSNTIGKAKANTIAFNKGPGIMVSNGAGNRIYRNAIFSNEGLGIDLGSEGVTENDPGDSDTGGNNLQNFPLLISNPSGIGGMIHSVPNSEFQLDFYSNGSCDSSGHGEGEVFLGSIKVSTNAEGNAAFEASFSGPHITATASDKDGNTSEFSPCERSSAIYAVEFTQAIQQLQSLHELKAELAANREPPVPIVARKPAVMRVYFSEVETPTQMTTEVSGLFNESQSKTLHPGCTPDNYRRMQKSNGVACRSADFYFIPPEGSWSLTLTLKDKTLMPLETHTFNIESKRAKPLALSAVKVCDTVDAKGTWQCEINYHKRLAVLVQLMRQIAPTGSVWLNDSGDVVRRDTNVLIQDSNGDGKISSAEARVWWRAVLKDIDDLWSISDKLSDWFGYPKKRFYGMVRPVIPGDIVGRACGIPSKCAMSQSVTTYLGVEDSSATAAHETFHTLGRRHTNKKIPVGGAPTSAPGCVLAPDSDTDWPYPDNHIRSGDEHFNKLEVGFDLAHRKPLLPESTFDIMSYCTPQWISAHTYRKLLKETLATTFQDVQGDAGTIEGSFWLISGTIEDGSARLDPLFELETAGPVGAGSGDYRIEVRSGAGGLLFVRFFTPSVPVIDVKLEAEPLEGPPVFVELIPVQAGASSIVVIDDLGTELVGVSLSGTHPTVNMIFPTGGEWLSGPQTVKWETDDADSSEHTFWVQYSPNQGALGTWRTVARSLADTSLVLDFDELPGADASGLIRILASDGINTVVRYYTTRRVLMMLWATEARTLQSSRS